MLANYTQLLYTMQTIREGAVTGVPPMKWQEAIEKGQLAEESKEKAAQAVAAMETLKEQARTAILSGYPSWLIQKELGAKFVHAEEWYSKHLAEAHATAKSKPDFTSVTIKEVPHTISRG